MNAKTLLLAVVTVVCTTAAQCPSGAPATVDADSTRISGLEREARAIAKTDGCGSVDQCRTAPVGDRPCGGPRAYIVYCARTTDSAALFRKLDELRQAEMEYNRKSGMMSTCEFRMPPAVGLTGGQCKAMQ